MHLGTERLTTTSLRAHARCVGGTVPPSGRTQPYEDMSRGRGYATRAWQRTFAALLTHRACAIRNGRGVHRHLRSVPRTDLDRGFAEGGSRDGCQRMVRSDLAHLRHSQGRRPRKSPGRRAEVSEGGNGGNSEEDIGRARPTAASAFRACDIGRDSRCSRLHRCPSRISRDAGRSKCRADGR